MLNILKAFVVAIIGGTIFYYLHIPLPWMLGSLASVLLWNVFAKRPIHWPAQCCYAGLLVVGYAIGRTFTVETGQQILLQLPVMLMITIATALFSLMQGYSTHKKTGINLPSGMLGSIPGGMSQMAVLCAEVADADITVVTFMQTARQLAVIFVVPFLALHGFGNEAAVDTAITTASAFNTEDLSVGYVLLLSVMVLASGFIARFLKFPTPYLLGAVLGTALWVLNGLIAPQPPREWLNMAQVCIGAYAGARMQLANLNNWKKLLPYTVLSVIGLLLFSLVTGWLLAYFLHIPIITAFLSTAPGGMAEMGLTAMMVHANMSVVVAFQFFRLLFVLIVVPPLIKWFLQHKEKTRLRGF